MGIIYGKTDCSASIEVTQEKRTQHSGFSKNNDPKNLKLELLGVDLRPLELTAVVYVDCLPLCEEIIDCPSALAMPVPRLLHAAEWHVSFCTDGRPVDVRDARLDVTNGFERLVHILCVDR